MQLLDQAPASKPPRRLVESSESGSVLVSRWRVDHTPTSCSEQPLVSRENAPSLPPNFPSLIYGLSSRNAFRDQLFGIFRENLFSSNMIARAQVAVRYRGFFAQLIDNPDLSSALEYSMIAVCTSNLGQIDKNAHLAQDSLSFYARSLNELRRAVNNPTTRCQDQTLAACMALMMYEFSECPGQGVDAYLSHMNGAMRLLQLRGAGAHTSGFAHTSFSTLRSIAVSNIASLVTNNFRLNYALDTYLIVFVLTGF